MKHVLYLSLSLALSAQAKTIIPTTAIVPLGNYTIKHPKVMGEFTTVDLTLDKIKASNVEWMIECDYEIKGQEFLSAITFQYISEGYYDSCNVLLNDDIYTNNGIVDKSGTFSWGPVTSGYNSPYLEIQNFDLDNDLYLNNCIAYWVPNDNSNRDDW